MKKVLGMIGFISMILLCFQPVTSLAEKETSNDINDFSYEVLFPENQKDEKVGYYDLLVHPGEKQVVHMKLSNTSNQPMKVAITISSAKTNGNGVAIFSPSDIPKDSSLKYDLSKIMTGPKDVLLAPNSQTIVDLAIEVPEKVFEGYIAGGIQLKPVLKEETSKKDEQVVLNKFAFVIGVLLSESEIKNIKPELKLNDVSVKLKDTSYTLFANFSNTKSVFAEELTATIKLKKKGDKKALLEVSKENLRMAPNSIMELPIFLEGQKVTAGEYTADIKMTTKKSGESWHWTNNFTFSKIEAEQINKQESLQKESPRNYWRWIIGIVVILLVISSLFLLYLKKKTPIK
ncbi:DUF916 and DUF3324 domain-containing protein [Enterococcus rotai]|uniref:DUF916 and DUF3324 domain-containing protein n=1 Tax=Enterococcus rotai TaxID=118060 RepID=UPI0032B5E850